MTPFGRSTSLSQSETTILDACVVINLHACRRIAEIIGTIPGPVVLADRVFQECRFDPFSTSDNDGERAERMDLRELIASERLGLIDDVSDDELRTYVDLAIDLDDGEAMTLALAIHRGYTVVTDDRAAIRMLGARAPLRSTLDLVREWAEREAITPDVVRATLTDLRGRGRYVPGRNHPLRAWWDQFMSDLYQPLNA
ncbi:MAG: hypothetical protein ACRDJH_15265 [Thermomicrobiales bacterium]